MAGHQGEKGVTQAVLSERTAHHIEAHYGSLS